MAARVDDDFISLVRPRGEAMTKASVRQLRDGSAALGIVKDDSFFSSIPSRFSTYSEISTRN